MEKLIKLVGKESAAVILFPVLSKEKLRKLALSEEEKKRLKKRLKVIGSRRIPS